MNIHLSKNAYIQLKNASKALGFEEDVLAERAVHLYLNTIRDHLALKKEFQAWDTLSDEALSSFEKKL